MAQPNPARDLRSDTWVATDALGRELPGRDECGPPRSDRFVGIFYFLWLGAHSKRVHDVSDILVADPDARAWGPPGAFHFWGEPHLGYYRSDDEFVIRRHAQMLADAGVDVLFFDVTNGFTYERQYLTLCRVFERVRETGRTTPQIAFLTNSSSGQVVQRLFDGFYAKGSHSDLWFRWEGKPLILAKPGEMSPECRSFFTVRQSWAWTNPRGWFSDGKDKWPWLDHYPQQAGWHDSPAVPEELPVAVAQHPVSNIGRSFHDGKQPPPGQRAPERGLCFAEQWRRALEVDPRLVFITGWNEWVAQRFIKSDGRGPEQMAGRPLRTGDTYFVDQYNQEYSRDIEPMRDGHGDNYYYQMVAGIRRFKGVRSLARLTAPKTIHIDRGFDQWRDVGPAYLDDVEDTQHRNHPAWEPLPDYLNASGRNDFESAKVARDATHIYFYVHTREAITARSGANWMVLLLNTDSNSRTGWEGFDFAINRHRAGPGVVSIERNAGGWRWEPAGQARLAVDGQDLHLAAPRRVLGLEGKPLQFDFKWTDNVPESGDIMDFIDQGDVAPNGRFCFRCEE